MSSYLNIGFKLKNDDSPMEGQNGEFVVYSESRNNELYSRFYEGNVAPYGYENRRTLTESDIEALIGELIAEISRDEQRLMLLYTRATTSKKGDNSMNEYFEWKEFVDEKKDALANLRFIQRILSTADFNSNIDHYYCYID